MISQAMARASCGVVFLSILVTFAPKTRADGIRYSAQDLGTNVTLTGMNNLGQVVGIDGGTEGVVEPDGIARIQGGTPFLYSDGNKTTLSGVAYGINDSGQLAQTTLVTQYSNYQPVAINASGETAGWIYDNNVGLRPATGMPQYVSLPSGIQAGGSATGLNNAGQVVGWTLVQGTSSPLHQAFLWSNGQVTNLGLLLGPDSKALAINNAGQVIGYGTDPNTGVTYPFLYTGGKVVDLGLLGAGTAVGINDKGQVVGFYEAAPGGALSSYLYQNGVMSNLTQLVASSTGISDFTASGINNAGQIIGGGYVDGTEHAFLLTPAVVPEPTTLATFAGILLVLRRKHLGSRPAPPK